MVGAGGESSTADVRESLWERERWSMRRRFGDEGSVACGTAKEVEGRVTSSPFICIPSPF
jgi:hypothetical protein